MGFAWIRPKYNYTRYLQHDLAIYKMITAYCLKEVFHIVSTKSKKPPLDKKAEKKNQEQNKQ